MKILLPTLMLLGLMALVVPDPAVFQRLDDTGLSGAGTETRVVAAADVDGDGSLDVFLGNFGQDNDLHLNRGGARFDALPDEPVVTDGGFTFGAAFGDMDGDGDPDLAVANGSGADNALYRNLGRPNVHHETFFAEQDGSPVSSDGGSSYDVDWADIDGDNDLDLLFANTLEPTFVYRNSGNGVFTKQTTGVIVTDNEPSRDLDTADLDGDGDVDFDDFFIFADNFGKSGTYVTLGVQAGTNFTAAIDEAQAGDTGSAGSGSGTGSLNAAETEFNFSFTVSGLADVTAVHFHNAPAGSNGGVVRDLGGDLIDNGDGTWTIAGVWASDDTQPLLADELKAGNVYINVHTTAVPAGEIRGQVVVATE